MSYLQMELDALNKAPAVGRAAGISENDVLGGLLRLWAWCFREEVDVATDTQLRGHFGADVGPALEAFGFLERQEKGWRVRGAYRYLRRRQAQRDAAAQTNEMKALKKRAAESTVDRSVDPRSTPNTKHQTPNTKTEDCAPARPSIQISLEGTDEERTVDRTVDRTEERMGECAVEARSKSVTLPNAGATPNRTVGQKPKGRPQPPQVSAPQPSGDPRHHPLRLALEAVFERVTGARYPFQGRDAKEVTELLKLADPSTLERAWDRALRHTQWPTVRTLAQLRQHLPMFIGESTRIAAPPPKPPCVRCGGEWIGEVWDQPVCAICHHDWQSRGFDFEDSEGFRRATAEWAAQRKALQ